MEKPKEQKHIAWTFSRGESKERKIPGGKVQKENPRGKIQGKENPRLG